jgi:hypothetical protein
VPTQHPGDLLHRLKAGPHGLRTPAIEKAPRPGRGEVRPEELELFLQQVGTNRPQVIGEEGGQPGQLGVGEVRRAREQQPAGVGQYGSQAAGAEGTGLVGADVVDGLAQVGHDVEPIEDVPGQAGLLGHDPQVGRPHVAADEAQGGTARLFHRHPEHGAGGARSYWKSENEAPSTYRGCASAGKRPGSLAAYDSRHGVFPPKPISARRLARARQSPGPRCSGSWWNHLQARRGCRRSVSGGWADRPGRHRTG